MKNFLSALFLSASAFAIEPSVAATPSNLETAPTRFVEADGIRFAYRSIGASSGTPLIMLQHFTGTIDYWDPAVVNGLASKRHVIVFDNTGVGASSGKVPDNVEQMTTDAVAFIKALGYKKVDLLGYSLGGMVAQDLVARYPELVRKVVLANTVHRGGGNNLMQVLNEATTQKTYSDPRMVLFFSNSKSSLEAGQAFLKRTSARQKDRDPESGPDVANAHAKALIVWSSTQEDTNKTLNAITHPVLIATGSNDTMLPTQSSYEMFRILKNAKLVMYPDSNHGAIFQYHDQFVTEVNDFLDR